MNVTDQVKELLVEYPTLFKDRLNVLFYLFCTITVGYEWIDGELVSQKSLRNFSQNTFRNAEEEIDKVFGLIPSGVPLELYQSAMDQIRLDVLRFNNGYQFVLDNLNLVACCRGGILVRPNTPYFGLARTSPLLCLPSDIKPDWKEAAKEIAEYVYTLPPEDGLSYHERDKEVLIPFLTEVGYFKTKDELSKWLKEAEKAHEKEAEHV